MYKINEWQLPDQFTIAEVDRYPDDLYNSQLEEHLMGDYPMLPWQPQLSGAEAEKVKQLRERVRDRYDLRLALLHNNELVGWSYGWQEAFDSSSFFMGASLVMPQYRRNGLYTELAKKILELTQNLGFQSIWSTHIMTNNPIIIAKLKMGFSVNGFESNVQYGNLVKLTYHHSDLRKRATNFRAGAVGEAEVLKLLLGK